MSKLAKLAALKDSKHISKYSHLVVPAAVGLATAVKGNLEARDYGRAWKHLDRAEKRQYTTKYGTAAKRVYGKRYRIEHTLKSGIAGYQTTKSIFGLAELVGDKKLSKYNTYNKFIKDKELYDLPIRNKYLKFGTQVALDVAAEHVTHKAIRGIGGTYEFLNRNRFSKPKGSSRFKTNNKQRKQRVR